ncbi:metal-dependent hydrolase [Patescibacteria group bacterium]|nr:metal-dependent hydrolase [Patescibacteria group bacterium]
MRNKIVQKSQTYHILIHVLFGIMTALIVSKQYDNENLLLLLLMGFLGNTLPDIDHVIYFLTYGRDSEYSQIIKLFIKERHFREIKNFLRDNHKYLTGLYSHTLISPVVSIFLTYFFFQKKLIYPATFFFSVSIHFLYDILEDILFFGKLNPNWCLKFNNKNKNNEGILFPYLELLRNKKRQT